MLGNTIVSITEEDKDGNKTTTASYDLSKPDDIKAMQDQFGIRKGQIQAPKKQSNLDQYKQDTDAQAIFDKMTDEDFGEEPTQNNPPLSSNDNRSNRSRQQATRNAMAESLGGDQDSVPPPPQQNTQQEETPAPSQEAPAPTNTTKERDVAAEDKKMVDLMRNSELNYGGDDGSGGTMGLPQYKNSKQFETYLNSKEQVKYKADGTGSPSTYGKSKHPKRGLKTDLGEDVYNSLSEPQQAMMRMQHFNIPWDPRVVMLMATGDIKGSAERTKYLSDYELTTKLYNKNKAKFKNIDDAAMFDQWVDIYANTKPQSPAYQKQYKQRVIDLAKAYGITPTKEQLAKFKV